MLIAVMALVAGACSGSGTEPSSTSPPSTAQATTAPVTTAAAITTGSPPGGADTTSTQGRPRAVPAFADLAAIPLRETGTYPGPAHPADLSDVLLASALRGELDDPAVSGRLATEGFVVVPGFDRLFHNNYEPVIYDPYPVFVTTDAAYHVWHLVFSKALRELEEGVLLPMLEDLLVGLLEASRIQEAELAGSPLGEHATRATEWFQAAGELLELDVGPLSPRAAAEVELARDAAEMATSPVTSFSECMITVSPAGCVDYTQFRVRGHYNRSEDLQRYFRAMSMLGQTGFFLGEPDSMRIGMVVARLLEADPELARLWQLIYEPTAFLVGLADDFTPFELADAAREVTPDGLTAPVELADDAVIREVEQRLLARRSVGINAEAASVRVMGARFVVDSFILDQLTWPYVGEEEPVELRRVEPSPLDVAAAFGSEYAYTIQEAAGETAYLHYDEQLDAMRSLMGDRTIREWAGTVYDAWLYALEPMWAPHGEAYPDFMRSGAWTAKAHQTGFGSYAELKHDTILYGKQGFAAEAGGEPPAFTPRHWVEPDPVAFARIAAVARLAQDGLSARGLLEGEIDDLFDDFTAFVDRLARLADDELAGQPISEDDNLWLESVGALLESLWLASADIDEDTGLPSTDDQDAAIVADIFRSSFNLLEIGTGKIDSIYVLVPNDEGRFQVARGGVYSYYEFWRPAEDGRLTDEEWRDMLDGGTAPDRPSWQAAFLPGNGAGDVVLPAPQGTLYSNEPGLFCRDLQERGHPFDDAVRYWWWDGSPERMDADGNGIPCETVYTEGDVASFWTDRGMGATVYRGVATGALCRDLDAAGLDYLAAFEYWLWDGRPERMDADHNGVPCETVYDAQAIGDVLFDVGYDIG